MVGKSQTFFLNPFHKHDVSEFEGVYQPLSTYRRKSSIISVPKEKLDDGENATQTYEPNTIESLKAEIDADVAASGHDSIYDRMCCDGLASLLVAPSAEHIIFPAARPCCSQERCLTRAQGSPR